MNVQNETQYVYNIFHFLSPWELRGRGLWSDVGEERGELRLRAEGERYGEIDFLYMKSEEVPRGEEACKASASWDLSDDALDHRGGERLAMNVKHQTLWKWQVIGGDIALRKISCRL